MPELPKRLGFDLPDTFSSDVKLLADFLQCMVGVHFDPEAHAQDLGFP